MKYISYLMLLSSVAILPAAAMAQTYDTPDVEINRSVLKELKGYTPPPMFSETPAEPPVVVEQPTPEKIAPPKSEDILDHPVENFHVLTEQKPTLTVPQMPSKVDATASLPVPTGKALAAVKKDVRKDAKKDVKKEAKGKERLTVIPAPTAKQKAKAEKASRAADFPKAKITDDKTVSVDAAALQKDDKAFVMPKVTPRPYKLKSSKTMPAVPSVGVEKSTLPPVGKPVEPEALVIDATQGANAPGLTAPEQAIDKSLDAHLEKDNNKIKNVLAATLDKADKLIHKSKTPDAIPAVSAPPTVVDIGPRTVSFEFKTKMTDLSQDQMAQIDQSVMPSLNGDKALRAEIRTFAVAPNGDESAARRVALSRALALRQYFIDKGIPPARMDLRAMGSQSDQMPLDRADIIVKR